MKRIATLLAWVILAGCSGGSSGGTGGGSDTGGGSSSTGGGSSAAGGGTASAGGGTATAGGGTATGGGGGSATGGGASATGGGTSATGGGTSATGGGTASTGGGTSATGGGASGIDLTCSGAALPTSAPAMVTITGKTVAPGTSTTNLDGATVVAATTSGTVLGTTTSGADGSFMLTIATGGVPVDLVLKATHSGRIETDWYPAVPVSADEATGEINVFDSGTLGLLGAVAGYTVSSTKSQVFIGLNDCADNAIGGATVSATPSPQVTRYIHNGVPSSSAASTDSADGAAVFGNAPVGDLVVAATSGSTALRPRHVASVANIVIQVSLAP